MTLHAGKRPEKPLPKPCKSAIYYSSSLATSSRAPRPLYLTHTDRFFSVLTSFPFSLKSPYLKAHPLQSTLQLTFTLRIHNNRHQVPQIIYHSHERLFTFVAPDLVIQAVCQQVRCLLPLQTHRERLATGIEAVAVRIKVPHRKERMFLTQLCHH